MLNYDSINWIFSTMPQVLGVFLGLLIAGVSFSFPQFDRLVENNQEYDYLYKEVKKYLFFHLKIITAASVISILADIFILFFNKGFCVSNILSNTAILVLIFNFCSIIYTIIYIGYSLSPKFIDKVNENIKSSYEKSIQNEEPIDAMRFLSIYIKLEKILRKYSEVNNIKPFNIKNILYQLKSANTISGDELANLLNLTTIRNMVVHGKIDQVDKETFRTLQSIVEQIETLLNSHE